MENYYKWDRNLIQKLIDLWQQHENLFDPSNKNFRNTKMRINSYTTIFKELKKGIPDDKFTLAETKRKFRCLRVQYGKELQRHQQCCAERGISLDATYKPTLWCYNQLHFLKAYNIHVTKEIEKIQNHPLIDKQTNLLDRGKRKIAFAQRDLQQQIISVTNLIKNREVGKYDWLGKQVSTELANIQDASIQEETSCAIQLILHENIKEDKNENFDSPCPTKQFKTEIDDMSQDSLHIYDDDTDFKGKTISNDDSNFYVTEEDHNPLSTNEQHEIDDIFLEEDDVFSSKVQFMKEAIKKNMSPSKSKKLIDLHEQKTKAEIIYFQKKSAYFQKQTDNLEIQRKLMILQAQKVRIEIEKLRNDF